MYKQLAAEREAKIQELGGTTRSADAVKSELERRDDEKHKLERDIDMYGHDGHCVPGIIPTRSSVLLTSRYTFKCRLRESHKEAVRTYEEQANDLRQVRSLHDDDTYVPRRLV